MDDLQAAWLAGLFEGEGCITLTGKNSVTLALNMTDRDVIEKCMEVAGVGRFHGPYDRGPNKPMYTWSVGLSSDVEVILKALLPWFGSRRSGRAAEALGRLKGVRRRGFCKREHPMSGANLYVSPGGQRICRACAKRRDTERRLQ